MKVMFWPQNKGMPKVFFKENRYNNGGFFCMLDVKGHRMNDLLKWISRAITPMGYHVRPRTAPNFLKVSVLESAENQQNLQALRKICASPITTKIDESLNHLHIFLRTCLRESRKMNPKPRLTGDDINENAYRCVQSLAASILYAKERIPTLMIDITIMDDRSDAAILQKIKSILNAANIPLSIKQTNEAGQGASLHETFVAGKNLDSLVYFVEEDYLHQEDGIFRMLEFYQSTSSAISSHMVIYPQEHNELYSNHYPSYILAGADRHWRTTRNATHTFLTHGKIVEKFWLLFENTKYVGIKKHRRKGSEDRTTNKLFEHIPGFSPLKPCAVHLQYEELLPPFFNWRELWDKNKVD